MAALVVPANALADCAKAVDTAAFKGSIAQYYPQACYTAGLKKLGADAHTYSPNVARNLRAAMRRDRTRTLAFTIVWLRGKRAIVTANAKLATSFRLRAGTRTLARGSIAGNATQLRRKRPKGKLTVALIWKLGHRTITVTRPATGAVAANLKLTIHWLPKHRVRIRSSARLAGSVQLRSGAKIVGRGAIDGTTTTLRLATTQNALTVALIWTAGRTKITITKPARVIGGA